MEFVQGEGSRLRPATAATTKKAILIQFEDGERIELPLTELPLGVASLPKAKYMVKLSGQKDRIWTIYPATGAHACEFARCLAKEGQPPIPQPPFKQEGRNAQGQVYKKTWLEFGMAHRILAAPYAGLEIPAREQYQFARQEDGLVGLKSPKARATQRLAALVENGHTGGMKEFRLQFSDNVLPGFERAMIEDGKPYLVILNPKGFVDTYAEAPASFKRSKPKKVVKKKAAAPKKKKASKPPF